MAKFDFELFVFWMYILRYLIGAALVGAGLCWLIIWLF